MTVVDHPTAPSPRKGAELREPTPAEARAVLAQSVSRLAEVAHAAQSLAESNRVVTDMHLKQCREDREEARTATREASRVRGRMFEEIEGIKNLLNSKAEALITEMNRQHAQLRKDFEAKVDKGRKWAITLILTIAGSLILLLLGVVGWLVAELLQRVQMIPTP